MKSLIKKIYISFFLLIILLGNTDIFAKESKIQHSSEDISNYFSGKLSIIQDDNNKAFKHLKKVKSIKDTHSQFNIEFLRTLVLMEKFKKAISFSKDVWDEDELFFEADLLLGINAFIEKDYQNAKKYFKRLNDISQYNLIFDNFIGNILLSWVKAAEGNEKESLEFLKKIPVDYYRLKDTQKIFLKCYFDSSETQKNMEELIYDEDYNFSRYNFFLINYLISKNNFKEANKIIEYSTEKYKSNLLLKQTQYFFHNNKNDKILNLFNCKNPKDSMAELFYLIGNLYSTDQNYRMSNFYLKISLFLNKNFLPNKTLLAENYYYQKKNKEAKNIYYLLKSIGPVYSWHSSKSIATIDSDYKSKEYALDNLLNDFNLLSKPSVEHYYELANFYKDNEYFEESIEYYSIALNKINKDHFLAPKILDRRGTSFERIDQWKKAERDLSESLEILPDQPHVLNYLAYTWVDQGINLDEGLKMLKKAAELRKNDGYITDSLGWAYYVKKDYEAAEVFLQRAVELLPLDPVINDHYADNLWMLNKNIQARYIWGNILKFSDVKPKLKEDIEKKLIFGINKKL